MPLGEDLIAPPAAPPAPAPAMTWIPGGSFRMGSDAFYPEERPVRKVHVDGFWMDRHPVCVAEFRRFVKATGYVTVAERRPTRPTTPTPTRVCSCPARSCSGRHPGPVPLDDLHRWWAYVPGACWHRPEGPGSDTYTRARHPVTQIAFADAQAYAAWAGKALPTEAQWERAARGGLDGAAFAWGDDRATGRHANTWRGEFPWQRLTRGTSPVGLFTANGYGLPDMTGNVWEWTADPSGRPTRRRACCAAARPADASRAR